MNGVVDFLVDLPVYGWAWSFPLVAVLVVVTVVHERRTWREMTRLRNQYRRRRIVLIDQNGGRRYA